jgi:hypothetical protein
MMIGTKISVFEKILSVRLLNMWDIGYKEAVTSEIMTIRFLFNANMQAMASNYLFQCIL